MANLMNEVQSDHATADVKSARVDIKLETIVVPVSDVDRAKEFYERLGSELARLVRRLLVREQTGNELPQ